MQESNLKRKEKQRGFTLIEIISVLVILGVLAAVAVPRFVNLTDEARSKAALQAVAEGQSRLSLGAASYILKTSATATNMSDYITAAGGAAQTIGDYTLALAAGANAASGTTVIVTASGLAGSNAADSTATGIWTAPE